MLSIALGFNATQRDKTHGQEGEMLWESAFIVIEERSENGLAVKFLNCETASFLSKTCSSSVRVEKTWNVNVRGSVVILFVRSIGVFSSNFYQGCDICSYNERTLLNCAIDSLAVTFLASLFIIRWSRALSVTDLQFKHLFVCNTLCQTPVGRDICPILTPSP